MKQIKLYVIILLLIVLVVPSVALAAWWNPFAWNWNIFSWFSRPQIQVQKQQENVNSTTTFNSQSLGINFQYDPTKISIDEKGRIININFAGDTVPSGDYVQVFDKDSSDSLVQAIKKNILADFPSPYCRINVGKTGSTQLDSSGWISGDIADATPGIGPGSVGSRCNGQYIDAGSPGIFLYNSNYPTKFLFWRTGAALNTDQILSTFKFITPTTTSASSQPSIIVTSPNGGETWKVGETHNITWTAPSTTQSVRIFLDSTAVHLGGEYVGGDLPNVHIFVADVPANQGLYQLTVPNVVTGTYKILIEGFYDSTIHSNLSDFSNAPFSIIAPK